MWTLCLELHHTPLANGAESTSAVATPPGPIRGATTAALRPIAPRPVARFVLSVATPETTTLAQLHTLAAKTVGLESSACTASSESLSELLPQLVVGFPRCPQILPSDSSLSLTESGLVHNQDRIQVIVRSAEVLPSSTEAAAAADSAASSNGKDAKSNGGSGRPKRQAAAQAAVRIAAEIQPRPILPKPSTSSSSSITVSSPSSKKASGANTKSGTAASNKAQVSRHFAALSRSTAPTAAASSSAASSSPTASGGGGRRLRDGATISPPPPRRSAQRRKVGDRTDAVPKDTDSVAEGLLALASGSGNSTGQRLMRRGWRQAVQSAHEQTLSTCRVAAAAQLDAVSFRILPAANASQNDDHARSNLNQELAQLSVAYPKGVQGRGQYTDVVDFLDREVLVAAIAAIYPAEALRAANLALLSPRVYWSLLYHFVQKTPSPSPLAQSSFNNVVHDALQWSNPQLDWSYLRRRPVQLSAKARENLRQQGEANAASTPDDWEAAARAIVDVEQAMHDMPTFLSSRSDPQHRGTLVAGTVGTPTSTWSVVTPSEEDRDEIKECLLSSFPTEQQQGFGSSSNPVYHLDVVVALLCDSLQLHNWRELANVQDGATLSEQILAALESKTSDRPEHDHGAADRPITFGEPNTSTVSVSVDAVSAWIEYAQQQSLEEIIVEICDGQAESVDLLHQAARSGTPRDLAAWQSIAQLLHQCLVDYVASSGTTEYTVPNVAILQVWCDRAQQALEQLDWLGDFVTPIDSVDPLKE
jgi:hypothetical protein